MAQHFRVHEILTSEQLADFEEFAREPGRTIDELHEWLNKHQEMPISRSAVGNWKQAFDERCMRERMSSSGQLANAFMEAAKSDGGLKIPDAALMAIAQMIWEHSTALSAKGEVTAEALKDISLSMQRLTLAKGRLEKTRGEMMERQKKAIDAASKAAAAGASAGSVVETIKQALGIGQTEGGAT